MPLATASSQRRPLQPLGEQSPLAALASGPQLLKIKSIEEQLAALNSAVICAFNQLLDLKDLNTGVHSTRLAEWALDCAGELGLNRECLGDIEVAALLHD